MPHVDSLVPRPHFSRTPEKWRKVVWARDYHVEHVESSIGRNGEARSAGETTPCMLSSAYPIHRSANKVIARVLMCKWFFVSLSCILSFKSVDQINFSNFTDLEGSCAGAWSGQVHPATGEPCTPLHPNATAEVEWEASLDCAQSSLCSQRHWERWCVQLSEGMAESAQWKDPLASKVCRCFKMFTECGEYMYITNHYVFVW